MLRKFSPSLMSLYEYGGLVSNFIHEKSINERILYAIIVIVIGDLFIKANSFNIFLNTLMLILCSLC